LLLAKFVFKVVDESRLIVGVCCAVSVEDEDTVGFYEYSKVEEVDENGGRPNKDVGEKTRVNLSKISGKKAIL
jgi:hypothetical protein